MIIVKFSTAFSGLFIILTIFLVTLSHKFYENQQKISDFIVKSFFMERCHGVFWNLAIFFLNRVLLPYTFLKAID
jgi:NADH-quinone oxidoreductase subunit N